jgi:hypothetical protein
MLASVLIEHTTHTEAWAPGPGMFRPFLQFLDIDRWFPEAISTFYALSG